MKKLPIDPSKDQLSQRLEDEDCPECHGTGDYQHLGTAFECEICHGEGVMGGGDG